MGLYSLVYKRWWRWCWWDQVHNEPTERQQRIHSKVTRPKEARTTARQFTETVGLRTEAAAVSDTLSSVPAIPEAAFSRPQFYDLCL